MQTCTWVPLNACALSLTPALPTSMGEERGLKQSTKYDQTRTQKACVVVCNSREEELFKIFNANVERRLKVLICIFHCDALT